MEAFSNKLTVPLILSAFNVSEMAVTEQQVPKPLKKLSNHKSLPDIPIKLYKAASPILASSLTKLFKESTETAIVPKVWKISAVIPVLKTKKTIFHKPDLD